MVNTKVVMGLSGGMDSSTLLGFLLGKKYEVHCCNFVYGSKHNKYEIQAADQVIGYYKDKGFPVYGHQFDLSNWMASFKSALMLSGEEIPEGHYNDDNMKKTVVPGRNLIFTSIMAGLAESIGAESVHLGIHAGDHHIYPDCRPDFLYAVDEAVRFSSDLKVRVRAVFLRFTKKDILKIGYSIQPVVPYHLTRTCYKDQPISCGKCGSCQERLEAFSLINKVDPIEYEKYPINEIRKG